MPQSVWLPAGYAGFAGVDVGVTSDGRLPIFDANLRLNGSTVPLLVAPPLPGSTVRGIARFRSWRFAQRPAAWEAIDDAGASGVLAVLATYAPDEGEDSAGEAAVQGLMLGGDRTEATRRAAALEARLADGASSATGSVNAQLAPIRRA